MAGGAEGDGACDVRWIVVRAEHHDRAAGELGAQLAQDAEAVDARHSHVEQDHVGPKSAGEADRFVAVGGVSQEIDVANFRQQTAQTGTDDFVIIGD
jgi:hypothetical protein